VFWVAAGIVHALFAVPWAVLYQAPIAFLVAYLAVRQQGRDRVRGRAAVMLAALAGGGMALVFAIHLWLGVLFFRMLLPGHALGRPFTPGLAVFPALAISWWLVSYLLDRFLHLDLESTHRMTGAICAVTCLAWVGAGLVAIFITDPAARPW
jgi:hypothetical protein